MSKDEDAAAGADELIEALGAALAGRVAELRRAEQKLADFAFREGGPEAQDVPAPDWQHFVLRAFAVAGEPANFMVLERLVNEDGARLDEVGAWLGADRLAVVDRVSVLTQTGYVSRDLESDRVTATPLAGRFVELIQALTTGAARHGAS